MQYSELSKRWNLTPDGKSFATRSSDLFPVLCADGTRAILKITRSDEERIGNSLMVWWGGDGAVRVLAHDGNAVLLERAAGDRSLVEMARNGNDSLATSIICEAAVKLHAKKSKPLPELVPLRQWFDELTAVAKKFGGVLQKSLEMGRQLLDDPMDMVVLHGDLHHGNVLDAGNRGWLAIDPKGLLGESGFDFANIFCNPDFETATAPGRLAGQATVVAQTVNQPRVRVLQWILAYAGLSAAWDLNTEDCDPGCALAVAEIAALELNAL